MKERISYIRRGATVAWGPTHETASYIAAGTVAGAISDSFDASASLEIFNLDLPKRAGTLSVHPTREAALGLALVGAMVGRTLEKSPRYLGAGVSFRQAEVQAKLSRINALHAPSTLRDRSWRTELAIRFPEIETALEELDGLKRPSLLASASAPSLSNAATADSSAGFTKKVRGQMPQLKLIDEEDELRERVLAAKAFNTRHVSRSTKARGLLCQLDEPEKLDWQPLESGFNRGVREVFRNRYWLDEELKPHVAIAARRRRRKRWRLDDSIWAPRKLYGNSKDYYETDESMRTVFNTDWEIAGAAIAKMVERAEELRDSSPARASSSSGLRPRGASPPQPAPLSPTGSSPSSSPPRSPSTSQPRVLSRIEDSVAEVGEALWAHRNVAYGAFDYYACLMTENERSLTDGEVDIYAIGYNAFTEFARDCGLVGKACPLRTLDLIWTSSNKMSHSALNSLRRTTSRSDTSYTDRWNHEKTLSRHEFLQAIVRLANVLYVDTGVESTVASAVLRLCLTLKANLPPEALQDSNLFRNQFCYNEQMDRELVPWEESLRAIFSVYSRANRSLVDELQHKKTMSVGEWLTFLNHYDLLQTGQISTFGAKMVFKWSMIRARPDHTAASERKMRQLTFIDFVEALVRVACLMALPIDAELDAAEAHDAGEYLHALEQADALHEFIVSHKVGWQGQPRQPSGRCVAHLISLLIRTAVPNRKISDKILDKDRQLTEADVSKHAARRQTGAHGGHDQVQTRAGLLDGVRASASIVRARLLSVLRCIDIFDGLGDDQFEALARAMSHATFQKNQYVFDQGAEGDAFYVITEGVAAVLRTEPDSHEEKELGILGEGAFFGERALIKNQVRYAAVVAESAQLFTVYITRDNFERAVGMPLEKLVPDKYRLDATELKASLTSLPLLKGLTLDQIKIVADRCTEMRFPKDTDIVKQGEKGDMCYIITRGTADVLHWPSYDKAPPHGAEVEYQLLTSLGDWDAFGERALLMNERRYATVRVTSDELVAMGISRTVLEAALGRTLRTKDKVQAQASMAAGLGEFVLARYTINKEAKARHLSLKDVERAVLADTRLMKLERTAGSAKVE